MVLHGDIQQAMQATLMTEMRHKCTRSKSNLTWRHLKFHLFILYTALHIFQAGIDPETPITESQARKQHDAKHGKHGLALSCKILIVLLRFVILFFSYIY